MESASHAGDRLLILLILFLFLISAGLLLVASSGNTDPLAITWQGLVDNFLALALVILALFIGRRARNRITFSELSLSYNLALLLFAALLLGMWVFADAITWDILLPGLAWRVWLLLYLLPRGLALWRSLPLPTHFEIR